MSLCYRYALCRPIPFPDVLATLNLSLLAVESIHGEERTRLDARYVSDPKRFALVIDAETEVGQALNQVFTGFARREFGETAFKIERVEKSAQTGATAA